MPKSKVRKKNDAPARAQVLGSLPSKTLAPSPTWYPIVMAIVLVLGLAYLVAYYLAPSMPLLNSLGGWNFAVGFGIMVIGLIMAIRWR